MSFLGTKFSQEFVSSADGKVAADNLLATIRKSKEHIIRTCGTGPRD